MKKSISKTILIIDNNIPAYDISAGYRTTDMYIDIFLKLGFKVTIIPLDFLQTEPYYSYYKNKSVEILTGSKFKKHYKKWIKEHNDDIEYVLLNTPRAISYINFIKKNIKAKIVYHGRDMHFVREYEHYKLTKSLKHLVKSKLFYFIEKYLYKKSDIFITVSLKEKAEIKKINPAIDAYYFPVFYYKSFNQPQNDFDKRSGLLFVGANHYPNIDAVKWFVESVLPLIKKEIPLIKFYAAGNLPEYLKDKITDNNVVFTGRISDAELLDLYNKSKIAVMPLRFGAGVKGKTIEAMHNNLPIVATSFALEGLPEIENIIKAKNTAEEFAYEIIRLYNDNEALYKMSEQFNEYVKNNFSYEKAYGIMKNIFKID